MEHLKVNKLKYLFRDTLYLWSVFYIVKQAGMSFSLSRKVRSGGIHRQPHRETKAIHREAEVEDESDYFMIKFNIFYYEPLDKWVKML